MGEGLLYLQVDQLGERWGKLVGYGFGVIDLDVEVGVVEEEGVELFYRLWV